MRKKRKEELLAHERGRRRKKQCRSNQGRTLVSPYVGMVRKQDGDHNTCCGISAMVTVW